MTDSMNSAHSTSGQDELAPLMAGARARGMADAFALLGVPALLLGEGGRVLHVNRSAAACMGAQMAVSQGHFLLADPEMNRRVQVEIWKAVTGEGDVERCAFPAQLAGRAAATVRILAVPGAARDAAQLLKAVLVLDSGGEVGDDLSIRAAVQRIVGSAGAAHATH